MHDACRRPQIAEDAAFSARGARAATASCHDARAVNILYVASEVARYAKTGGLADVSAALPRYLWRAGHDVRVFMPYYNRVDDTGASLEPILRGLQIKLGDHQYEVTV